MPKLIKLSIITLLLFIVFSISVFTVYAADPASTQPGVPILQNPSTPPPEGCTSSNCGNYTLNEIVGVAIVASNFILGIVGSLALLAFIYGGVMWLISAGSAERVDIGKKAITGAVVGLVIVFTSYMIIQLVFTVLGIDAGQAGKWATINWFKDNGSSSSNNSSFPQGWEGPN